jgi:hypothetical protein
VRAHRLTMSRMARAHVCAFPFRIDVEARERPSGKEARAGTVTHHWTAVHLGAKVPPLTETDPTILAIGEAVFKGPLKTWLETTATWTHCEVGLLYSAAADVCIDGPRRGEPGYDEVSAMELRGTLDLVRVEEDRIVLRDLKTGKPPSDREQLYAQAVAASRRWKKNVVEIGYVRALKTKVEELDVETLDADRLDEEAGRIARVLRRLPMAEPVVNDKCDWCDARGACPAYGAERASVTEKELEAAGFFG